MHHSHDIESDAIKSRYEKGSSGNKVTVMAYHQTTNKSYYHHMFLKFLKTSLN